MSRRGRTIGRPPWCHGVLANGDRFRVGTGLPAGSSLLQWHCTVGGARTWHDTLWDAHGYLSGQVEELGTSIEVLEDDGPPSGAWTTERL